MKARGKVISVQETACAKATGGEGEAGSGALGERWGPIPGGLELAEEGFEFYPQWGGTGGYKPGRA